MLVSGRVLGEPLPVCKYIGAHYITSRGVFSSIFYRTTLGPFPINIRPSDHSVVGRDVNVPLLNTHFFRGCESRGENLIPGIKILHVLARNGQSR